MFGGFFCPLRELLERVQLHDGLMEQGHGELSKYFRKYFLSIYFMAGATTGTKMNVEERGKYRLLIF